MQIIAWCSQNTEQSQSPRTSVRVMQFSLSPTLTGGNATVADGKVVGSLSLQNVTPEMAEEFAGGAEVDVTITVRPPS